jgi:quinoprotein glucose dehydrogenase
VTGKPVWPIEERPVPQIAVPGDRHSPTQPFPTKPALYSRQGYHEDELIDFTLELKAEARVIAERYVRGPMYTPTTPIVEGGTQGTWIYPGYGGGANWNGGAFDPETGLMFVPTRNMPMVAALSPADPALTNWKFIRAPTEYIRGPRGLPINRPPWSVITATDMNRGEHVWSRSIGGAPAAIRNHPALKGLKLDFDNMGHPSVRPSPLVTKTLLFLAEAGNLSGDPGGPMFRAYDKRTGAVVAEIELPSKATGAPMTYLHEGRQYIVIAVATQQHPAELVALALPDGAAAPASIASRRAANNGANGVAIGASANDLRAGREIYARSCAACHGSKGEGVSGSTSPLAGLSDLEFIRRVVIQGSIKMPPMRTQLTKREIEQVSKFVAVELNRK